MKNELLLIEKVENKLQERNPVTVFPLSPTHRKELRNLRDENIGDLRSQLSTIKSLKRDEYCKKYAKDIEKKLEIEKWKCEKLNKNWDLFVTKYKKMVAERKELEKKLDTSFDINRDYSSFCRLCVSEFKRKFSVDVKRMAKNIAEEEFGKRHGKSFEKVQKKIDDLNQKYEEAINFGDLNLVKEIYYIMKGAEGFFEQVRDMEV